MGVYYKSASSGIRLAPISLVDSGVPENKIEQFENALCSSVCQHKIITWAYRATSTALHIT